MAHSHLLLMTYLFLLIKQNVIWSGNRLQQNHIACSPYTPDKNQTALVVEYFGQSLQDYMKNVQKIQMLEAIKIFLKIAEALLPLHELGIIHRDLKPSNILINHDSTKKGEFQIKICDFGLAELTEPGKKIYCHHHIGTTTFHSPQVLSFKEYSDRSDIWSLGLIFYILLYKKLPYNKQLYADSQKLTDAFLSTPVKFKNIPKQIAKIGEACFHLQAGRRPSAKQIIETISSCLLQMSTEEVRLCETMGLSQLSERGSLNNQKDGKSVRKWSESCSTQGQRLQIPSNFVSLLRQMNIRLKARIEGMAKESVLVKNIASSLEKTLTSSYVELWDNELTQELKHIMKALNKLKIICQFTSKPDQIPAHIKQFVLIDLLHCINESAGLVLSQKHQESLQVMRRGLLRDNQPQETNYYWQLRRKIMELK